MMHNAAEQYQQSGQWCPPGCSASNTDACFPGVLFFYCFSGDPECPGHVRILRDCAMNEPQVALSEFRWSCTSAMEVSQSAPILALIVGLPQFTQRDIKAVVCLLLLVH